LIKKWGIEIEGEPKLNIYDSKPIEIMNYVL